MLTISASRPTLVTPVLGVATATNLTITGLTGSRAVATDGSSNLISVANTGSGNNVLATSPTLITPVLGVASATTLTLTNPLGIAYGGTGVSTSTGTGDLVLATSPTLITPNIGAATAASLTITGLTALQAVATDASKNLISVANTGSGNNVLATSPTLVTPILGVASATTLTLTNALAVIYGGTGTNTSTGTGAVVLSVSPVLVTPDIGLATGTSLQLSGLTASQSVATDGSNNLVSVANTGTGNNVLATSPTLTTPNIGAATGTGLLLTGLSASGLVFTDASKNLSSVPAGILAITNGGTGASTSTGTGAVVLAVSPTLVTPILGAATGTSLNLSGLTASRSVHTDASKNLVSVANTGTGNNVLATSPTLITPVLGVASATTLTLTNALAVSSGGTGTTSSTGSGSVVLATSPTLVTPILGIASGTSLNLSGLTASQAVATDASKNLISVATTGTGSYVLATSPTLVSPVLGVASATTLTLTNPLGTAYGGTGTSSSTGTGALVLANTPTLITPNIGAATGTSLQLSSLSASGFVFTDASSILSSTPAGILPIANGGTGTTTATGTGFVVLDTSPTLVTPILGSATGTSLQLSGLTASQAVATDGSKNLISIANTGSGNNVLATSPTLVTPVLGVASATTLTLTNPLGTAYGGTGTASSTGTGALVLANTPTLITPILGSATGTSLQLSGLTASQSVHTDASKNLVSIANTGTGNNVLATSPTLVTPSLGVASATTLTLTNPLSTSYGGTGTTTSTGTGDLVLATSPTLVTPNIGSATGNGLQLLGLAASGLVFTDASKNLSSSPAGILGIGYGGTGTSTSTGSGAVVLATSPALITPNIGAAVGTSLQLSSLNTLQSVATDGSMNLISVANTGTGNNVLATSPILVTPTLGVATATSITLSSPLSIANGGTGTNVSTGTGANVFATSPTLVTPNIGSATGTGLLLNNLTPLRAVATDAAKNLISVNTTGSGNYVLATSPVVTNIDANNTKIANVADPILASDVANKAYVDSSAMGLKYRPDVIAATVVPGTLASSFENGDTIDGVVLTTNDRILIKNQANNIENGIYFVNASGSPTRVADLTIGDSASSIFVFVLQGALNANSGWICTNLPDYDIVNTNGLDFKQFAGGGIYAGTGLTKTGNTISVNTSQTQITELGTITVGSWQAAAIGISYGGTGTTTATGSGAVVLQMSPTLITPNIGIANATSLNISTLTPLNAVATDVSGNLVSVSNNGIGSNVLSVSPTLITPVLGVASATTLTLTNALDVAYGGTGTTSSTGSGSIVLSISPTLVTPILGVASGTNLTLSGLTASQAVQTNGSKQLITIANTGTGSNVLSISPTFVTPLLGVATATSLSLGSALAVIYGGTGTTTSTGSGSLVLSISPTLVTPVLGTASATNINISGLTALQTVATDSSKNLISVGTIGTGNYVLANTPTISNINANNTVITNLATPIAGTDAATKDYVDLAIQGIDAKGSVTAATTVAGTLATSFENGDVIDGVGLVTNQRILLKNQTNAAENGIYIVNASGAPTRSSDFDTGSAAAGAFVFIEQGTANASTGWLCINVNGNDTVGVDNIIFTQFSGAGTVAAGTGLTKTGNTLSVNASQTQVTAVGTLITGTWNATTVAVAYGGTGTTTSTGTGSTVLNTSPTLVTPNIGAATGVGLQLSGLTASRALATDASKNLVSITNTGSGNNVLAISPTLVTPILGAAAATSLTLSTALAVISGGTGTTTSTGAGSVVLSNSPTLVSPVLGSASGTSLNLSGLSASQTVATDGSKNLISVATTGTGNYVLATSPTLVSPNIDMATGISLQLSGLAPSSFVFTDASSNLSTTPTGILPVVNGGTGTTTSTGSGSVVLNISPTLTTPILGAATGISLQLSGLNASQAVATDASKNLVSLANTGTGNNVLATSPILVTPTLGVATATSLTLSSALAVTSGGTGTTTSTGTGSVVRNTSPTLITPILGTATAASLTVSGLTASQAVATNGSNQLVSVANTGTGNNVLATSPTLVTPTLGIASATSLSLTNALNITYGGTGATTATGSGSVVLQTSPTLITPDIGIAVGTSLQLTGLSVSQSVATDASSNLISVPNTGTGNNVLATSPTLVTPILGVASATTLTLTNALAVVNGGTGVTTSTGTGSVVLSASPTLVTPIIGVATGTSLQLSGLTASQSVQTDASKNLVSVANTGTGNNVLATSPTLITPNIGSAVSSNLQVTGLTASTFVFTDASKNLSSTPAGILAIANGGTGTASSTGTGALVLANTPTLITPVLGVATGTSLNLSGLTASQTVATDASKNLVSVATTGTGNYVLVTSPTLVTPILGVASATTLTLTNPLAIASGGTGTASSTGTGALVLANTPTLITPVLGAATGTSLNLSGLTASQAVATDASKNLISVATTGTGNYVLASTPTISNINANNTVITNAANPIANSDVATKSYVDASAQGLQIKDPVVVATTVAGTLASSFENGDTIDGVVLVTNDRILLKNQTNGIENGIYIVNASGAPSRSADLLAASSAANAYVFIVQGTINASSSWVCTNTVGSDIVGTDILVFTQFSGSVTINAGTGLTKTGNTLSVNASQTQITAVGTLTTGTWQATTVAIAYGGTGSTTATGSGSVVLQTSPTLITPILGAATGTSLNLSGLTVSSAVATDASKNLVSIANTGTGNNVLATSPTLITPILGAASATSLTLSTALAVTSGGTGTTTSTGSGSVVLSTSPTLTTPILGTATGTNLTLTGLTASQSIQTNGSSQLVSIANTGTGSNVLSTSPTLVTPILGAASATSLTLTNPLAVADGGTGAMTSTGTGALVLATSPTLITPILGAATGTSLQLSGLTASQAVATDASKNLISVATTGSGSYVLATSPTLVTPTLGVASATSIQVTGLTASSFVFTDVSSNLSSTPAGILAVANGGTGVSSSTGTGSVVLSTSPTLVTPILGVATGTSLQLSGLTASQAVATDASKNLISVATTGSGSYVLATSPTLVTPILGVASATSLTLSTPLATAYGGTGTASSTGTGALVLANTPTLITPNIGAATGTSLQLSGLAASSFVFTDVSSNLSTTPTAILAVANGGTGVSSSTGSGSVVLSTSPTLVTPTLGAATGTSLILTGLTASQAIATNGSNQLISVANTGTGDNVLATSPTLTAPILGAASATSLNISGLTASQAVATDASKNLISVPNTGTGNNVLATSPTLVTPVLGVASATTLTLTNALAVSSGGTGVTTSTGSGSVVLSTSPTLVTPVLGAASSTSLNISSLTASTFVFTDASKNLTSTASGILAIANGGTGTSTATGTGDLVLATSPTLITPILGAATGTSLQLSGLTASQAVATDASKNLISVATIGSGSYVLATAPTITNLNAGNTIINNLLTPSANTDAATKGYVDSVIQSSQFKNPVIVATTTAGTLATSFENGDTVDGVVLATGNRILIKNQASAVENGIYTVNISGAPTRSLDLGAGDSADGVFVIVEQGTSYADTAWICTSDLGSAVVGTDNLTFATVSGGSNIIAGTGLTLLVDTLSVNASQTQVTALGTITTGTWNATTVAVAYGGTGTTTSTGTGSVVLNTSPSLITPDIGAATGSGLQLTGLNTSGFVFTNASKNLSSTPAGILGVANGGTGASTSTGSGAVVLATSPTLVTPNIGAAVSSSLQVTGLTASSFVFTNASSILATTSSAILAIANGGTGTSTSTGTGDLVLATSPTLITPNIGAATGTSLNLSGLTASSAVATDASKNLISIANTGTGNNVLATSPTFVTPILGAASATSLTLSTPLAIASGGTGAATSTGTGSLVLANTPTLITPILGVASGTSLNLTSLSASTFVFTDASKNLTSTPSGILAIANGGSGTATATGTGNNVLATSPTLVTPNIGAATGTSLLLSGLTASSAVATDASKNLVSIANTGTGNNVLATSPTLVTPILGAASATSLNISGLTASGFVFTDASKNLTSTPTGILAIANGGSGTATATGTGNNVLATSPTLVTPILGVATGTNLTLTGLSVSGFVFTDGTKQLSSTPAGILPIANGGTGSSTSTGSGAVVLATSPTLITPIIGVAAGTSLQLSSLTASSFIFTDASKNLTSTPAGILAIANGGTGTSTSTGTGNLVLATSPTLVTPVIGAASGTSLNLSGLTASQAVATDGSKNLISIANTGTGNNVLASSPTISSINANNTNITNVAGPISSSDVATKSYVDAAAQGLKYKTQAVAATTVNGALATAYENGDVIDGVTLVTGDRILLKNQTSGIENGIYTVNVSGAPTRASDLDTSSSAASAVVFITSGTANMNTSWICINTAGSDIVGTDSLTFAQLSGTNIIVAGTGLTKTVNTLSVNASQTQITALGTLTTGVWNATTIAVAYGGTGATTSTGTGSVVLSASPTLVTPIIGAATGISLQLSGLNASQAVATDGSKNLVSIANTGTGNNVLATSPTLVTPVLGAATGTSLNLSGLTASSAVHTDISKNLVSVANTGTGNNVLATSPVLTTPNIGSASGTGLNLSGLSASGIIFTDASKNLSSTPAGILAVANGGTGTTTATGTGSVVLSTSAVLVTPTLGAAIGTSLQLSGLNASSAVATDALKNLVSVANTGTGSNVLAISPTFTTPNIGSASASNVNISGLTASTFVFTDASKNLSSTPAGILAVANGGTGVATSTGTGSVVLSTSPTLVTPTLGAAVGTSLQLSGLSVSGFVFTDASKNLSSTPAGILAVANGGTGASTSTGTGAVVLATSPTLVTPILGAATGTSLNLSGLTASQSVATDASKNLVSVANTGTGNNVLATSPTLVTPILGTASATNLTISGLTASTFVFTDGAKNLSSTPAGTLGVANGGTGATSITQFQVVMGNNTAAFTGITPDTAGKVLTSNGVGVAPTFQTPSFTILPPVTIILTTSGTYISSGTCKYFRVQVIGAGGGGGGGKIGGGANGGGGGGGGGSAVHNYAAGTYIYTIGTSGTAGTSGGGAGGAGGSTAFNTGGTVVTAAGGNGGEGATTITGNFALGGNGGIVTTAVTTTINYRGNPGTQSTTDCGGSGGGSSLGGGPRQGATGAAGVNAVTFGAGGSGGGKANVAGGAGGAGAVIVTEYF